MATRRALLLLRRLRIPALLSLASLLAPAHAASLSHPLIEHRVSTVAGWAIAGGNGSGPGTDWTLEGFGPSFDEVVEGNLQDVFTPPPGRDISVAESVTQASQTSALTVAEITSNGVAMSGVSVEGPDGGTARSQGTAEFHAVFSVDAPTRFSFSGEVDCFVFDLVECNAFIIFTGAEGEVLADLLTRDGSYTDDFTGTLLPGVNYGMRAYTDTFGLLSSVGNQSGLGAYRLHLELLPVPEVPEPVSVMLWALGLTALVGAVRGRRRG